MSTADILPELIDAIEIGNNSRVWHLLARGANQGCQLPQLADIENLALDHAGGPPPVLDQALFLAAAFQYGDLEQLLVQRGADTVAVAKRALRDKRGDVLRGLDVLTGDIPAEQREKLLALNAKAFPAIQASVEAKQRLAQVVLVTAVRVALPGEP